MIFAHAIRTYISERWDTEQAYWYSDSNTIGNRTDNDSDTLCIQLEVFRIDLKVFHVCVFYGFFPNCWYVIKIIKFLLGQVSDFSYLDMSFEVTCCFGKELIEWQVNLLKGQSSCVQTGSLITKLLTAFMVNQYI